MYARSHSYVYVRANKSPDSDCSHKCCDLFSSWFTCKQLFVNDTKTDCGATNHTAKSGMRWKICHMRLTSQSNEQKNVQNKNPDLNCSTLFECSFNTTARPPVSRHKSTNLVTTLIGFASNLNANRNIYLLYLLLTSWLIVCK